MKVTEFIRSNITYLDGGMGTLLQSAGLGAGELPERLNISRPELIESIHRAYFDAGSNIVCTNTFGANPLKFDSEELEKIICAAVKNARNAAESSISRRKKFIALDIGPLGKLLKPYGDLDFEDSVSAFAEAVRLGAKYGVDLIFIETMNDSYETKAALLAAKENCDLPVFVSNAYGEDGKLMTGASPEAMVAMLEGMGADAIGVNCSLGPDKLAPIVRRYLKRASVPVLLKPNAGLPKFENGKTVYDIDPDGFALTVTELIKEGVRLAGGCCGTTPEYIEAVVEKTADITPVAIEEKNISCVSSYTHAVDFGKSPILIGERINPTGKKRFKQALVENDMGYILEEGLKQKDFGVQILDVNVGLPEICESEMLESAVTELQAIIDLPLQIDTADPLAMERALRLYNGKAMINSVSGKEESMKAVFPLAKKYGGFIVALTLDENGIPNTAEGRYAIAEKIYSAAKEYGIEKKDLIFDPLAMAISADAGAAEATLKTVRLLAENGFNSSLGISNVSFGLPARDAVNSVFFATALDRGLSAAIMNPYSIDMMRVYHAYKALHSMDENFSEYIAFSEKFASVAPSVTAMAAAEASPMSDGGSPLKNAIIKGLAEKAGELTAAMLDKEAPLDIVSNEVIPALDIVGKGFEAKTVYLPQLLMSAEAAKAAFEKIKQQMQSAENGGKRSTRCKVVIATVHGDIHDIGKNIVKLLLENYGFEVIDLGKDVPPETIAETVERLKAPLVGLSSLMTTTVPAMADTIGLIRERTPKVKIVVGGAVLTKEYADMIGADFYAKDAMAAVRFAEDHEKSIG
ncbi:MAG: homocysteine S-methyltransferase family protein [Clostridia bacterium]|nr:homocysteine S-methyltransferase family protein [Clostridia bacterium]